jgi:hypothetical protein
MPFKVELARSGVVLRVRESFKFKGAFVSRDFPVFGSSVGVAGGTLTDISAGRIRFSALAPLRCSASVGVSP